MIQYDTQVILYHLIHESKESDLGPRFKCIQVLGEATRVPRYSRKCMLIERALRKEDTCGKG